MNHRIVALTLFLVLASSQARAVDLVFGTTDGGGGISVGGTLAVHGTVGQPDAGASAGGTLLVQGGLWWSGLHATSVLDPELPGAPRVFLLHPAAPNPFNPRTNVRFEVPHEGRVQIEVVDLRGRRVARLQNETLLPGVHSVVWNGRDDRGSGVASGTYFVRMRAQGFGAVRKVSLVK